MYGIFVSALNFILGWVFKSVIVKFVLYFGLWFVATEFIAIVSSHLPLASALTSAFGGLDSGFWWFADMFGLSYGLPMMIGAYVTRFAIRRIPLIG